MLGVDGLSSLGAELTGCKCLAVGSAVGISTLLIIFRMDHQY
jgi:hypothetical protein